MTDRRTSSYRAASRGLALQTAAISSVTPHTCVDALAGCPIFPGAYRATHPSATPNCRGQGAGTALFPPGGGGERVTSSSISRVYMYMGTCVRLHHRRVPCHLLIRAHHPSGPLRDGALVRRRDDLAPHDHLRPRRPANLCSSLDVASARRLLGRHVACMVLALRIRPTPHRRRVL